ncbi:MAG TPA: acyltransferase [Rhodocyclaceae bacterium]|nr:acyltransferase [Rhodocyclaceae bacterium]
MDNYVQYRSNKRFGSLDGLRALSIIAVIWHHTAPKETAAALLEAGTHGVSLFFAISGYLITTLMLRERDKNGRIDLRAFYMRRSLRIFPLYYATLLIYILVVSALERHSALGQTFFHNLPFFATYTSNIFVPLDGRVIFYFSWSLAAEEQFYLLWPLLLVTCKDKAALVLMAVIGLCVLGQLLSSRILYLVPLPILIGALLAFGLHRQATFAWLYRVLGQVWSIYPILILLAWSLATRQFPGFVNSFLFVALVGCCVIREDHALSSITQIRAISYIGSISYGMYLLHMLCKNLVLKGHAFLHLPTDGLSIFILTVVVTIAVGALSFTYFESIFMRAKARYAR